jgi:hypothetical protein
MYGWIFVCFFQKNRIEAVPDMSFFKGKCAWPKYSKSVRKLIEERAVSNKKYFFLLARRLGNQLYRVY